MSRLKRLLKPESRDRQELSLDLPPEEAMRACGGAVEDLGWASKVSGPEGRRMTVYEDFTKLSCGTSPIRLEIELRPEDGGRGSTVDIEATVPGVGAISSRHLGESMRAFAICLARRGRAAAAVE